jgi:hypothetical protein
VRTLGALNVNGRAQNETDGFRAEFSHALRTGRRRVSGLVSSPKETSRLTKFDNDDEVQEEVMTCFEGQAADFYDSWIKRLVPTLNKCLDNAGDYVEK